MHGVSMWVVAALWLGVVGYEITRASAVALNATKVLPTKGGQGVAGKGTAPQRENASQKPRRQLKIEQWCDNISMIVGCRRWQMRWRGE
ncbi:hypothetical protein QBC43DRAFT_45001 [Cladorrhinum sp. PSN259]|nr:hypothetical protein QBC43DRAFT_45001 [Cladorrhinum sp. PSN259]